MKFNGTIFSKPQQDQLKRALENGGKKYQLVKKTMRCTVSYEPKTDVLSITSPTAADKNILDVIKENNNCSLRLYRGLDTMTGFYVDLQPHQRESSTTANPTIHDYWFDFTGGLNISSKEFKMFSASFVIKSTEPNKLQAKDATQSMAMVNFVSAPPKVDAAFKNYTDVKCTICDLIWWELEEVTE